jgi:hypothetical protein
LWICDTVNDCSSGVKRGVVTSLSCAEFFPNNASYALISCCEINVFFEFHSLCFDEGICCLKSDEEPDVFLDDEGDIISPVTRFTNSLLLPNDAKGCCAINSGEVMTGIS